MEENSIFTNEQEVIDGIRKSAEAVGIDPNNIISEDGDVQPKVLARKNCKKCYGKGFLYFIPSPQKQKIFWKNKGLTGKFSKRKYKSRGPSKPKRKWIFSVSPDTEELNEKWSTIREQPDFYEQEVAKNIFCSCVKVESAN